MREGRRNEREGERKREREVIPSSLFLVRYHLSEDPKLLNSAEVPELKSCNSTRIAISPDARVVAVAISNEDTSSIYLYPTATDSGAERISILAIHRGKAG